MRTVLNSRLTVLGLVIIVVSLLSGVVWASGSPSPSSQAAAAGASLVVEPLTVVAGNPSLDILGAGFDGDGVVFVQIVLDADSNVSITGVRSNSAGAFHKKVAALEAALEPGVYTVLATGLGGGQASSPLLVVAEAK